MKAETIRFIKILTNSLLEYIGRFDCYSISFGESHIYLTLQSGINAKDYSFHQLRLDFLSNNPQYIDMVIRDMVKELERVE